ncbi:MAG TPA: hypothetical protein VKB88_44240 [Bryobacteraceae bacterium]|nr:hypothetical protein [Bryobacteraceae bacterium]
MRLYFFQSQLRRAVLGGMFVTFAISLAPAQTTRPHYVSITYMQTLPGKADEFRKFAETTLVKLGQSGVDDGVLDAYYIARLTPPYTTGSDYNYVQAVWYKDNPSLAPLDRKLWDARVKKAGFTSYDQYVDKRESLAKSVRTQYRTVSWRIGNLHAGNYMRAASWQVEPEYRQETAQFIQEYMLPLAQARVNDGTSEGWGVTRPAAAMMSNDEAGFSFSIVNVLKDADTLWKGPGTMSEEFFKKALPGKNYATYLADGNRLAAHRKIVTTRVFEVVALAGTPSKVAP